MNNEATLWIEAGIKVLSDSGKIELNKICKKRGKFKSSFYNIYPNFAYCPPTLQFPDSTSYLSQLEIREHKIAC